MTTGLNHFDGSNFETFASALILLCIEEDPSFRTTIGALVRHKAQMPEDGNLLIAWGREEPLVFVGASKKRRSDLWLRFEDGVVLIEVKIHSNWKTPGVVKQMIDQQTSTLGSEHVHKAILLAPGMLVRRLATYDFPKILWLDFLRVVESIDNPSRIVQLACSHWSQNVENDFGLPTSTNILPLDGVAAQAGCLVALLRAAIIRMGGKVKDVWFSSPDGRPHQTQGWVWVSVAVEGQFPSVGNAYVGIYTYLAGPPEGELGTFMEIYRAGNDEEPIVSVPFEPRNFSSECLNTIVEEFGVAFEAVKSKDSPNSL